MQAISPAYSTLYDTAPQIIRLCEPHAITDTFVSKDSALVPILVYQYVISSTEPRAQAVSTAAAVQTPEIFGVLAVFEVLRSLILHDESSFCNTGTCIPVSVWP